MAADSDEELSSITISDDYWSVAGKIFCVLQVKMFNWMAGMDTEIWEGNHLAVEETTTKYIILDFDLNPFTVEFF